MVEEAEKYKAEDDANKNVLENYVYSLKSFVEDPENEGRMYEEEKSALLTMIKDAISWLDESSQTADKEELEEKQKALEGNVLPILQKMGIGGPGMPPMPCDEDEDFAG